MLAQMAEFAPFATVKDYDNWIARINASGPFVDQWILQLTQGTQERLTQPRVIINKVLEQMKGPLTADPEANPFYAPFKKMPAGIPDAEKARLTAAAKTAIQTVAIPAYQRFDKFLREVYLPASRDSVGIYEIPGRRPVLPQPHRLLHDARQPGPGAHPQHRPRRGEAHPRRDGKDARGHQLPRHRWISSSVSCATIRASSTRRRKNCWPRTPRPRTASSRSCPSSSAACRRRDFGIRVDSRPPLRRPRPRPTTSRRHWMAAAPGQLLRESLQAGDAADLGSGSADRARVGAGSSPADRAAVRAHRPARISAATRITPPSSKAGRCTARSWVTTSACTRTISRSSGQLNYDMWRAVRLVVDTGMHAFKWSRDQAVYYFKQNTGRAISTSRTKSTATFPGRARRWRTS